MIHLFSYLLIRIVLNFQVYERLDEIGADKAEAKASHILKGLGFTKEMQQKRCKDFSGEFLSKYLGNR